MVPIGGGGRVALPSGCAAALRRLTPCQTAGLSSTDYMPGVAPDTAFADDQRPPARRSSCILYSVSGVSFVSSVIKISVCHNPITNVPRLCPRMCLKRKGQDIYVLTWSFVVEHRGIEPLTSWLPAGHEALTCGSVCSGCVETVSPTTCFTSLERLQRLYRPALSTSRVEQM